MHRVLALALVVAAVGLGGPVLAGEESSGSSLAVSADVGQVSNSSAHDEFWWKSTTFVQPTLTGLLQAEELTLELRARTLFAQDKDFTDDNVKFTGKLFSWDVRAMLGWRFKLDRSANRYLSPLVGLSYRDETKKLDDKTDSIKSKLDYRYDTLEFGLRYLEKFSEKIEWVTEVVGGPVLGGDSKRTDEDAGGSVSAGRSVDRGSVVEARSGVNWQLSKRTWVRTGAAWERDRVFIEDMGRHITNKASLDLGLVFKF
jgi:hypothetical protein